MNQSANAPARSMTGDPLYASIDGRVSSLGNDEVVFFDAETQRTHVMTSQVVEALNLCRSFQPMDVHVESVAAALPGLAGRQEAVRRVLEGLASRGLLISDDAFLARLHVADDGEQAPVAGLYVRACDRPEQLRALVTSLPEDSVDESSGLHRLLVVDDSRSEQAVQRHAQALGAVSGARETFHVTPQAWRRWVDLLSAEVPEAASAARSLLLHDPRYTGPRGGGQGRNLITLLSVGSRYLLLDDDNQFPLHRHPEADLTIKPEVQAGAIRTYATKEQALASGSEDRQAPAAQLALCGRRLGALLKAGNIRLERDDLLGRAPSLEPLLRGTFRIGMTVNGHRGASCSAGVNWLLLLDPLARSGFLADAHRYGELRADPAVWFGCRHFAVSPLAQFTPFAVDNSLLMPCTSPFGRGEDAVFNVLVRALQKDVAQLHVPWAVGHWPEGGRDRSALYTQPILLDANDCLVDFLENAFERVLGDQPTARISTLAALLEDLAAGSERDLLAYMSEFLAYRRSNLVSQLQQVIKASQDAPRHFLADLRSKVEANGRALIERALPRFAGWPEQSTPSELARRFREQALALAAGLRAWPALRAASAELAPEFLRRCRL